MKRSKVWMLASILALGGMSVSTVGVLLLKRHGKHYHERE